MSLFLKKIESLHPNNRVNWDEYFMGIALLSRARSPCERLQVGCVIVKNYRIVSVGYNGFLPGAPHTSRIINNHEQYTVHAEQNAIADASKRGVSLNGCSAYITHYPCINCTKLLIASGIREIKYLNDYKNDTLCQQFLEQSNVNIHKL